MSLPAPKDYTLYAGDTFVRHVWVKHPLTQAPTDITGWAFKGQLRLPNGTLAEDFGVTVIDAAGGEVRFHLTSDQAAVLGADPITYDYDWQFAYTANGLEIVKTFVAGTMSFNAETTENDP